MKRSRMAYPMEVNPMVGCLSVSKALGIRSKQVEKEAAVMVAMAITIL